MTQGKTVAVYFTDPGPSDYPLNKEYYRIAYAELAENLAKHGARLFAVRGMGTFLGGNSFARAWEITPGGVVERPERLDADIVYDKGSDFVPDERTLTLNAPEMDRICTDKSLTYALFPSRSPASRVVRSADEAAAAIAAIPSERLVLKPLDGEEGHGVMVVDTAGAAGAIPSYPYIAQEFLDLSGGIPGLVDATHDMRVTSIDGEIVLCFIRTPPPDSFLANVAQGGKKIDVPLDRIPDGAKALWKEVDEEFARFPRRVYSVDMGLTKDGAWKIIELNSKPGCTCRSEGPNSARFMEALAATLAS
jgi:glutathione synthase/RimK-type ligase-like ATP-grasp enzyme